MDKIIHKDLTLGVKIAKAQNIIDDDKLENKTEDKSKGKTTNKKLLDTYLKLTDEARMGNMLYYGTKLSGKSSYALPILLKQDLLNKDAGITIVVDKKDVAYTLYAQAKEAKRRVHLIKPSVSIPAFYQLLREEKWGYSFINDNIIDYKQAIRDKAVIIIDMEYDHFKQNAIRATSMLLLQLQADMLEVETTLGRRHYVYIDDAARYLPFIEPLLLRGDGYNISTTLFMQSRSQCKIYEEDYTNLLENNVKNNILMNGINFEDSLYWAQRLTLDQGNNERKNVLQVARTLMDRDFGVFAYEVLNEKLERTTGFSKIVIMSDEESARLRKAAIKARKKLKKGVRAQLERYITNSEANKLEELKPNGILDSKEVEKQNERDDQLVENQGLNSATHVDKISFEESNLIESSEEMLMAQPDAVNVVNEVKRLNELKNETSTIESENNLTEDTDDEIDFDATEAEEGLSYPDIDEDMFGMESGIDNNMSVDDGMGDFTMDFDAGIVGVIEPTADSFNPYEESELIDEYIQSEKDKSEKTIFTKEDEIILDSFTVDKNTLRKRKIELSIPLKMKSIKDMEEDYNNVLSSKLKK